MRVICFVGALFFVSVAAAQDPGEPIDTFNLEEDFQYRIDTGDWVTFTPSYAEEKPEPLPAEHFWVKDIGKSPVMEFCAMFPGDTAENPRSLWWGINTSTVGIVFPNRHHKFYMKWRIRNYPGTEYEIVGPFSVSSDFVRVVRIRPAGKVLAIKPIPRPE